MLEIELPVALELEFLFGGACRKGLAFAVGFRASVGVQEDFAYDVFSGEGLVVLLKVID